MKNLYREIQKIPLWWILSGYTLFLILMITTTTVEWKQISNFQFTNNFREWLFSFLILTFVAVFLFLQKLETIITNDFIGYRFFPYHRSFRQIPWNQVKSIKVRKYNAIWEFGGWGIKQGLKKKSYTLSGRMGIEVEFLDGRKLLIGTKRPIEAEKVLNQLLSNK